ncbi:MAG: GNAT family N-acetyltransferase [Ornithinimicrobium sp.]
MLGGGTVARLLDEQDREFALSVCAADPTMHVFVAARILEGGLSDGRAATYGYDRGRRSALCWSAANVVPVGGERKAAAALAERVVGRRRYASSLFGPAEQVHTMWEHLQGDWGPAREVRQVQPVMAIGDLPSESGQRVDPQVRVATDSEVDIVMPAAEAMFTEEIGYPPYRGSGSTYRSGVAALIRRGHTLIRVEGGQVIFKADFGSVALGVAQVQGVWVHPDYRGAGLAVPAMASVVEHALRHVAGTVTLYVNDYNTAALATYRRLGMAQAGEFSTILL